MKYIFNNHIIFDGDAGTLSSSKQNGEAIHLSWPGRRLMLLLIQHHGETVARNIIFQKVWDDYGMTSSNNNLNQCVSNIRKSLRKLGADEEIIITVPKTGLTLKGSISLQQAEAEKPEYLPPEDAKDPPGRQPEGSLTTASCGWLKCWLTGSTLVIFSLIIPVPWRNTPAFTQPQVEVILGSAGSCQVKLLDKNTHYSNRKMMKEVLDYTEQLTPECGQDEYVLITTDALPDTEEQARNRFYFMQCSKIMNDSAELCRGLFSS